jgi:hypothetical protein
MKNIIQNNIDTIELHFKYGPGGSGYEEAVKDYKKTNNIIQ